MRAVKLISNVFEGFIDPGKRLCPPAMRMPGCITTWLFSVCIKDGSEVYLDVCGMVSLNQLLQAVQSEVSIAARQAHHSPASSGGSREFRSPVLIAADPFGMCPIVRSFCTD